MCNTVARIRTRADCLTSIGTLRVALPPNSVGFASNKRALLSGLAISVKAVAAANPAVPPPTMTKSNFPERSNSQLDRPEPRGAYHSNTHDPMHQVDCLGWGRPSVCVSKLSWDRSSLQSLEILD